MKKVLLAAATTLGLTVALVACNNGGGGGSSPVTTPQACSSYNNSQYPNSQYPYNGQQNGQVANTCGSSGYVQTAQGCLPMWQGNPNYGNYNGTQVPVTCSFNYGPGNQNGFGPNNGWGQPQYPYGNNGYYNQYYYYYYGNPQPVPLVPGFMGNAGLSAGIWFH